MPTPTTTIRFTPDDLAKVKAIQQYHGLTSAADAIRLAVHAAWRKTQADRKKLAKGA